MEYCYYLLTMQLIDLFRINTYHLKPVCFDRVALIYQSFHLIYDLCSNLKSFLTMYNCVYNLIVQPLIFYSEHLWKNCIM